MRGFPFSYVLCRRAGCFFYHNFTPLLFRTAASKLFGVLPVTDYHSSVCCQPFPSAVELLQGNLVLYSTVRPRYTVYCRCLYALLFGSPRISTNMTPPHCLSTSHERAAAVRRRGFFDFWFYMLRTEYTVNTIDNPGTLELRAC